jgi:beta-glucosidase
MRLRDTTPVAFAGFLLFGCSDNAPPGGSGATGSSQATAGSTSPSGGSASPGSGSGGGTGTSPAGSGIATSGDNGGGTGGSGSSATGPGGGTGAGGSGGSGSIAGTGASGASSGAGGTPVNWPSAACQAQTATLLKSMTRLQKAQQMVMLQNSFSGVPGAVFSGGGAGPADTSAASWATYTAGFFAQAKAVQPPIPLLYGLDIVHGNNASTSAVIMPHNAGLGATGDLELVQQVYNVAAQEALAVGINWTFGPFSGVVWDYRWGRVYESFGGDPVAVSKMVQAAVIGLQGPGGLGSGSAGVGGAVACAKHFAGDGQAGPPSGKGGVVDRGDVTVSVADMMKWGASPYVSAIQAGLGCVMVSDATWNGAQMTESKQLLTTILKGPPPTGLGFKGFVITDWDAGNTSTAVANGVDMFMHPGTQAGTIGTIAALPAGMDGRIDDAVTRILNVKCQAGLSTFKPGDPTTVGSMAHRMIARQAVAESMVVLQNTGNVLPLAKTSKVFVEGSGAANLDHQCGGWTISWQGGGRCNNDMRGGHNLVGATTISQGVTNKVTTLAPSMAQADVDIVVLSEPPYAEFCGDSRTLDTLPGSDFTLLAAAKAAGKKVVAVVMSGRPVLLHDLTKADAWIAAWLPGSEGDGVADVLFGNVHPVGKLPHHWPATDAQATWGGAAVPGAYTPMFKIGDGLTW